ncbi:MAG TPA: FxsA family protein [Acidimicrobiia bacterium]|nr:FxsA family protein [Acidimicrobiia bacterium]
MRFLTAAALIAIAEMATFLWVGSRIGFGWALGIALATALIGSYLVRSAGLATWGKIRRKLGEGRLPGRELVDGAAILVAGAFLISPGFITDTLGFLLLVPAVRTLIYQPIARRLGSRVNVYGRMASWPADDVIDVDEAGGPGQIP